jgi:FkbM family methyltransferase
MILNVGWLQVQMTEAEDRVCYHAGKSGFYEPDSLAAWMCAVVPGKVALDIGAYTGLYSIIAAKLGARAVAIEPMPAQQWRLSCNAQANKADVKLLAAAASDQDGAITLWHNPRVALTTGASVRKDKELHRDSLVVGCIRVDSLALSNVAAIKIDVEHHEDSVVRGAADTIASNRPVLLVETLTGAMRDKVLALLPSYEVAAVLDGRNTLFVPQESTLCRKDHSQAPPI